MSSEVSTDVVLTRIEGKLGSLEKQLKSDFRTALAVGIIVAAIQVGGAIYITSKQEGLKAELASRLEANSELGRAIAKRKVEFFTDAVSLLDKIDRSFQEACYFDSYQKAVKELPELLETYRTLLAQPTVDLNSNQAETEIIVEQLRKYPKYVVEKWSLICAPNAKISDNEKNLIYKESQKLLKESRSSLSKLISIK